jgi:hypothetical protein
MASAIESPRFKSSDIAGPFDLPSCTLGDAAGLQEAPLDRLARPDAARACVEHDYLQVWKARLTLVAGTTQAERPRVDVSGAILQRRLVDADGAILRLGRRKLTSNWTRLTSA